MRGKVIFFFSTYDSFIVQVITMHLHVEREFVEGRFDTKLKYNFTSPTTGPEQLVELVLVAAALQ